MAWKPCRSSGIMFDKYTQNVKKHSELTFEYFNDLSFPALKKASKHLYFWIVAENNLSNVFSSKKVFTKTDLNYYIRTHQINTLNRNRNIIYKPLLKYLPNS